MRFGEIDRQIDEALERIGKKPGPIMGAYGLSPLASDHFLLKKSWDYFRKRVKTIEDQWEKIFHEKEAQIKALTKSLAETKKESAEIEDENLTLRSLDQNIKRARTEDYQLFNRKTEALRIRWDAERESLVRKVGELEIALRKTHQDWEHKVQQTQAREHTALDQLQAVRRELAQAMERQREIQKQCADELSLKDDKIQSLETKEELLRGEVSRRDAIIRDLQSQLTEKEKEQQALTNFVAELQRVLRDKDMDLKHCATRIQILDREKENLRAGWERERAEWRELWDRARGNY